MDLNSQQNKFDHSPALTLAQLQAMEGHKTTGERDALIANIMFGVGGAALVAAGVMAYFDYQATRPATTDAPAETSDAGSAAPQVSVGPGSVAVRLQF